MKNKGYTVADLSKITCIEDLRQVAECRVPRMFYDYADSGSWTEGTYRANESDFHAIKFRQRVAVNMEGRSTATTMVGQQASMPVCIAPVGLTGMQHADGEIHAARAAEKFGIPFTLSTMSICSIEDIAEHTTAPFWFQLYMMRDREAMARMIQRAKDAKCSALVLTLDLQVIGQRHKDIKNGLTAPPRPTLANIINLMTKPRWCLGMAGTRRHTFRNLVGHVKGVSDMNSLASWTNEQFDPRLSWEDVRWVKQQWGGKLILKGIMEVEMPCWPPTTAPMRLWSATTVAASWTGPPRPLPRCPRLSMPWATSSKCGWMAASAAAKTCSKPGRWGPKAP